MKKILLNSLVFFSAGFIFAESFVVKSVIGKAEVKTGSDKWNELSEGKSLSSSNVIKTNLNTILLLADENGKEIKIKPNQTGSVEVLVQAATTPSAGIKKAKITVSSVAEASTKKSKGTATASSRASEAKEDIDWDE